MVRIEFIGITKFRLLYEAGILEPGDHIYINEACGDGRVRYVEEHTVVSDEQLLDEAENTYFPEDILPRRKWWVEVQVPDNSSDGGSGSGCVEHVPPYPVEFLLF